MDHGLIPSHSFLTARARETSKSLAVGAAALTLLDNPNPLGLVNLFNRNHGSPFAKTGKQIINLN